MKGGGETLLCAGNCGVCGARCLRAEVSKVVMGKMAAKRNFKKREKDQILCVLNIRSNPSIRARPDFPSQKINIQSRITAHKLFQYNRHSSVRSLFTWTLGHGALPVPTNSGVTLSSCCPCVGRGGAARDREGLRDQDTGQGTGGAGTDPFLMIHSGKVGTWD